MAVKKLNVPFDGATYEKLSDVKGERTWQEAIIEEFGVVDETEAEGE